MNPDVLVLGYIGVFGLVCAALIIRETWVGWAMFFKNVAYAVAFGYGAIVLAHPELANEEVRRGLRLLVAVTITVAIVALVSLRVRRWRERRAFLS